MAAYAQFFEKMGFPFNNRSRRGPYTRYFTFSRRAPRSGDYDVLMKGCDAIDAYFGFKDGRGGHGPAARLDGFFILRGPKAYADQFCTFFPNFLIRAMDPTAQNEWDSLGRGLTLVGDHPFIDIRRRLFTDVAPVKPERSVTPTAELNVI